MQLEYAFYKRPLRFDVVHMAVEIGQGAESAWHKHLSSYAGNTVLILVSTRSEESSDVERHA